MIETKTANLKIISYLHLANLNKEEFFNSLNQELKQDENGFAGFAKRAFLNQNLEYQIFEKIEAPNSFKYDLKLISEIVDDAYNKCINVLPSYKPTYIYLFPSYLKFTDEQMDGVGGFTPYDNVIHLYIHQNYKDYAIKHTVAHEYNHSLIRCKWYNLLESLIYEGFAEHFRIDIMGGEVAPWSNAIDEATCKAYFQTLRGKLNQEDLHNQVFFGSKDYPMWLGYSLGYNIVQSYLANNPGLTWPNLMSKSPKEILKGSKYYKLPR